MKSGLFATPPFSVNELHGRIELEFEESARTSFTRNSLWTIEKVVSSLLTELRDYDRKLILFPPQKQPETQPTF